MLHLQPPQLRFFTKKADGLIEDPFVILAPWGPSEAEQGPETWGPKGSSYRGYRGLIKMLVVGGWALPLVGNILLIW